MKTQPLLLVLSMLLLLASCSQLQIQKRKYEPGFYVHAVHNKGAAQQKPETIADAGVAVQSFTKPQQPDGFPVESQTAPVKNLVSAVHSHPAQKKSISKIPAVLPAGPLQKIPVVNPAARKSAPGTDGDEDVLMLVLLIILCIFIPPLAVYLKEGFTKRCLAILLLWVIAVFSTLFIFGFFGILGFVAFLWALLIVLDVI